MKKTAWIRRSVECADVVVYNPRTPKTHASELNGDELSPSRKLVNVGWGLLLVVGAALVVEFASWLGLKRSGEETLPFLLAVFVDDTGIPGLEEESGEEPVVSYADPLLGFAHDPRANGRLRTFPGSFDTDPTPAIEAPRLDEQEIARRRGDDVLTSPGVAGSRH